MFALDFLQMGYRSAPDFTDIVCWRERCFNGQADWLANRALARQANSFHWDPLALAKLTTRWDASTLMYSDGGYGPAHRDGAAAWCCFVFLGGEAIPLGYAETYLAGCTDSFDAEVHAWHGAMTSLCSILAN